MSTSILKKNNLWLYLLLALLPAIILVFLVSSNAVNHIYMDEWAIASSYLKIFDGTFTFNDLIAQHNESRKVFPRLLFFLLASFSDYNLVPEIIAILITACIISLNIFLLSKLTVLTRHKNLLVLFTAANLMIFSPMQWENWIWGIQLIVYIPVACITACLLIARSKFHIYIIAVTTALLCTISTYSYANGMLSWFVVLPALFFIQTSAWAEFRKNLISRKWLILAWLAYATLNIGFYFYNYKKPTYHPSFLEAFKHPIAATQYFLTFLGSFLGAGSLLASQSAGALLLSLFVLLCFCTWRMRREFDFVYRTLPWFCIAFYVLLSAVITTLGRLGFGIDQALVSRYCTFSVYLAVALIYLTQIIYRTSLIDELATSKPRLFGKVEGVLIIFGIALITLHAFSFSHGARMLAISRNDRLYGKACSLVINLVQDDNCIRTKVYPAPEVPKVIGQKLSQRNLIKPKLIEREALQVAANQPAAERSRYGYLDSVSSKLNGKQYFLTGWAILPGVGEPAHGVLLGYQLPGKDVTPIAVAQVKGDRLDVAKLFSKKRYAKSGWSINLPKNKIPLGATSVIALAVDTYTGNLHRLQGEYQFTNSDS